MPTSIVNLKASLRRTPIFAVMLLLLLASFHRKLLFSAESPKIPPCSSSEYRDFDFWIGDWDAYDLAQPSKLIARNRVVQILNGCVLLEDYQPTNGSRGESFTTYDGSRKLWHQTWVTSAGKLLVIEGIKKDGEIVLTGTDRTAEGKSRLVRGSWKPVKEGVRETAVISTDDGKTWTPWFDILFRPHAQGARE